MNCTTSSPAIYLVPLPLLDFRFFGQKPAPRRGLPIQFCLILVKVPLGNELNSKGGKSMEKNSSNTQTEVIRSALSRLPLLRVTSLHAGWKGAILVLSFVTICIVFVQAYYYLGSRGSIMDYFAGIVLSVVAILIITGIIAGLLHWAKKMPSRYIWFMLASFCLLLISFFGAVQLSLLVTFSIILSTSLFGALLYFFIKEATARLQHG